MRVIESGDAVVSGRGDKRTKKRKRFKDGNFIPPAPRVGGSPGVEVLI